MCWILTVHGLGLLIIFPVGMGNVFRQCFFFSAFPAINRTNRTHVTGMVNCTGEASERLPASTFPSFIRLLIETGVSSGSSVSSGFSARKKAEDFWELFLLSLRFPSLFLNYFITIITYLGLCTLQSVICTSAQLQISIALVPEFSYICFHNSNIHRHRLEHDEVPGNGLYFTLTSLI